MAGKQGHLREALAREPVHAPVADLAERREDALGRGRGGVGRGLSRAEDPALGRLRGAGRVRAVARSRAAGRRGPRHRLTLSPAAAGPVTG